jgi:hypothetical protein
VTFLGAAPRTARPGRIWTAIAVTLQVIGFIGIVLAFALGTPTVTTEFDAGEPATVHLTAAGNQAIYADWIGRNRAQTDTECTARALGDGTVAIQPISIALDFTTDEHRWLTTYALKVSRAGDYEVSCTSAVDGGPTHYGIGGSSDRGVWAGVLSGGLVAMGIAVGLVGRLRRGLAKKRLRSARS